MSSPLVTVLFPAPDYRRTTLSLLGWWEQRRGLYNAIVGTTGLVTLVFVKAISWLPPGLGDFEVPWIVVGAYAVMANCCYSLGWLAEVAMVKFWGREAPFAGPALFRQGLAFSVGLTLLPILIASAGWVIQMIGVVGNLLG